MKANRTAQPDKLTKSDKLRREAELPVEAEVLTFKTVFVTIAVILVAAWAAGEYVIRQMPGL